MIIAVLCSDIHLSHTPPVARSAEPDWYRAQARVLDQLGALGDKYGPIVCAGDIFDRWNSPPELINFAIACLPHMFAIPGQHDLPHHNLDELRRSALWTLVEADAISLIEECGSWLGYEDGKDPVLYGYGCPWGGSLKSPQRSEGGIHLAVVHQYIWKQGHGYPGAPVDSKVGGAIRQLSGFDAAVVGDNHSGFLAWQNRLINCGCLIRRKQDERKYRPMVGLLHEDAHIEPHYLDTSEDLWVEPEATPVVKSHGLEEFLNELKVATESFDFRLAVHRYLESNRVNRRTTEILLGAMEEGKK